MTAPPLVFGMSGSPSSDRGSTQLSLGSERGDDLYALWKNVFDRAHAVQHSAQPVRAVMAAERDAGRQAAAALPAMSGAVGSTSAAADLSPRTQPGARGDAPARPAPPAFLASAKSGDRGAGAATAALPAAAASVNRDTPSEGPLERGRAAAVQLAAAQAQDGSTDSVSVHVQGAAVSIVVRDATLSERDALRLGFETARRLTGQRASLAQLTLNGRVAYQQQGASDAIGSALAFTC